LSGSAAFLGITFINRFVYTALHLELKSQEAEKEERPSDPRKSQFCTGSLRATSLFFEKPQSCK
jgi:hypothetical protein